MAERDRETDAPTHLAVSGLWILFFWGLGVASCRLTGGGWGMVKNKEGIMRITTDLKAWFVLCLDRRA